MRFCGMFHVHSHNCNFFFIIALALLIIYTLHHMTSTKQSTKDGALTIQRKAVSFTFKNSNIPQYH